MADHAELLKSMLQDIINDKQESATVTMHDYFVSKTREVAGLGSPQVDDTPDVPNADDDTFDHNDGE